jgi:hypothetical protein
LAIGRVMKGKIQLQFIAGLMLFGVFAIRVQADEIKFTQNPPVILAQRLPSIRETAGRVINDSQAAAAGISKHSDKRLTLYSDIAGEEIDRLPEVFAQAFPQWCEYFHIPPAELADWSMTGFLIKDKVRFVKSGLLPGNLPNFLHGFSRGYELWIREPPSEYYRRHLLLHEGTHGFMNTVLGGCGPSWYMEGMAEMLATHRWKDGRLLLNYFPKNRDEVPEWGRIRIIQDAVAGNRPQALRTIIQGPLNVDQETEYYAWCWAVAALLDGHPRYRERFRELFKHVRDPQFNQYVFEIFQNDWRQLSEEWQVFIAGLEYGYDIPRTVIDFTPGKPLPANGAAVTIKADRGWQNSGVKLQAGVKYRLKAAGRYQVASKPKIWWCEPGGVSIRYYQGRPLGVLLATVRPDNPSKESPTAFLAPITVGLGITITPDRSGTLFMKINDSAAELDDNSGQLRIEIQR